ncbi:hypothetical protein BKD26_13810 [Streptomyces sp. CB03238]|nr:hypothetical protein BKD26_13810 [Streptomyces sp. CB03238]
MSAAPAGATWSRRERPAPDNLDTPLSDGSSQMTASDITDSRPGTAAGAAAAKAANLELMASLIAEITGLPKNAVVPEADLVDDLYIDSVAKIELMVACETRFGVQIPDEVVNELRDVEAVLDYLAEHKAAS